MEKQALHIAIAIVGFRNPSDVVACLHALEVSTHTDFEVVICENGGPEAYAALRAVAPDRLAEGQIVTILLAAGNLGFAGGVNICLAQVPDADAWWVLNPDTEPEAQALAAMVDRLDRGDCDAVGCLLYRPDGRVQSYGGRWRPWLARAESIGIGRPVSEPVDVAAVERSQNYLNGASMLIGRRFLSLVGPMREDYFLYCEEVEWCLRGARRGMRLGFASTARVLHHQGTTTGAGAVSRRRPRMPVYLDERNKMLVTRDCFRARLPFAAVTSLILLLMRYASRGAWRQLIYGWEGWRAGLLNKRGNPEIGRV